MIPEQHDIEHYAWLDDVDDTRGREIELRHIGYTILIFACICGWAVWG